MGEVGLVGVKQQRPVSKHYPKMGGGGGGSSRRHYQWSRVMKRRGQSHSKKLAWSPVDDAKQLPGTQYTGHINEDTNPGLLTSTVPPTQQQYATPLCLHERLALACAPCGCCALSSTQYGTPTKPQGQRPRMSQDTTAQDQPPAASTPPMRLVEVLCPRAVPFDILFLLPPN